MKAKAKIILKSLADLPANTLQLMASAPQFAVDVTRQMLAQPALATRRQIRTARNRSAAVMQDIYRRANAPFRSTIPWVRGGLNE